MNDAIDLEELNHTELLALAKNLDENVCRDTPRETLIEVLECEPGKEPKIPRLSTNKHRLRIMEFVTANWDRLGALVDCPARSLSPFACYQCLDLQVSECWSTNRHIISEEEEKS